MIGLVEPLVQSVQNEIPKGPDSGEICSGEAALEEAGCGLIKAAVVCWGARCRVGGGPCSTRRHVEGTLLSPTAKVSH